METSISNGDNGTSRPLFGGALSCFMPNDALDASTIRTIPDNQEVFCHPSTDQSLMIDILEYQSHVDGEAAAHYHFLDLVESNDAGNEFEVILVESIPSGNICLTQSSEAWFLTGRQMVSKFKENSSARNLIEIHTLLYRLPQYKTDILMVLNSPIAISKESSSSLNSTSPNCVDSWTLDMFKQIACSLTLVNPGLFGED